MKNDCLTTCKHKIWWMRKKKSILPDLVKIPTTESFKVLIESRNEIYAF